MSKEALSKKLLAGLCAAGATLVLALPASVASAADLATAFNGTGKLSDDFGGAVANEIHGSALQSDGKLVVVGVIDGDGAIARFNTNGTFDMGFGGGDGITVIDSGVTAGGEQLRDVAIQSDGKIVAVGDELGDAGDSDFVLARVDSAGAPDTGFDGPGGAGNGVFRISPGTGSFALGQAVAVNGTKVIFGGDVSFHSRVYQLNAADGTLDTAGFGAGNGFVDFDYPCGICSGQSSTWGLAVQPSDGKIVAVGKPNNLGAGIGVARITTAGALDTTGFNNPTGMATLAPPAGYIGGHGYDVTVNSAGDIRIAGYLTAGINPTFPSDAVIAGVTPSGVLDTAGFGGATGYAIVPSTGDADQATGIARQPDGKLLVGGTGGNGGSLDFLIARYSSAGVLDTSFASPNGYTTTDISGMNSFGNAFELSSTGTAYVAGGVGTSFPAESFGIAAFTAYSLPPPPVLTGTDPVSPADDDTPKIIGTAQAGSTVDLYDHSACTGSPVLTGQLAADFASPGLTVTVASNSNTTFSAKATTALGTSECSTTDVTYTDVPAPPVLTGTDPVSPANFNTPRVMGTAEATSFVSVYDNAICTPPAAFTALESSFTSPGLPVSVPDNSTTTFSATAAVGAFTSACSTMNVSYTEVTPPPPPAGGGGSTPAGSTPTSQATGQRAAALKKCKKKRGRARANCKKRANKLPV